MYNYTAENARLQSKTSEQLLEELYETCSKVETITHRLLIDHPGALSKREHRLRVKLSDACFKMKMAIR